MSRFYSLEFILGAGITLVVCALVLASGWLFPDVGKIDLTARLLPPFTQAGHPFGTDPLGRDIAARLFHAGQISLIVGFAAGVIGIVVTLGLTVIANAPNPAGVGILQSAKAFGEDGISPLGLLLGALPPTALAVVFFWLL